jgi:acyl-coenzyme A thioesterase PaaI-like protein
VLPLNTFDPTGAHLNPWGTVHGGLTATLLASCMGLAVQSTIEKGVASTTLEFKILLVRAITLERAHIHYSVAQTLGHVIPS